MITTWMSHAATNTWIWSVLASDWSTPHMAQTMKASRQLAGTAMDRSLFWLRQMSSRIGRPMSSKGRPRVMYDNLSYSCSLAL